MKANRSMHIRIMRLAFPVIALSFAGGCSEETTAEKEPPKPDLISASQILITHVEHTARPTDVRRSFGEAKTLLNEVKEKIAAGEDFAELARKYSDGPAAERGGNLGNLRLDDLPPTVTQKLVEMQIGEVADVETQMGYHIVKRQPLQPMIKVRHILVAYKGADRAPTHVGRSKEAAQELAKECLEKIRSGASFESLVEEYSDGPTKKRGGDLGAFSRGIMTPPFEEAAFACEVGAVWDEVVETEFGFHILQRYE